MPLMTGISDEDLGAAVQTDHQVDMIEFLRLYAWSDVPFLKAALHDAFLRRKQVCAV